MATFRLPVPAIRRTGGPCRDLSPCPRRLQDIGLAFRWTSGRIFIWSGPRFVYRSTADRRNGRQHGPLSPFLLGHASYLHCPQVSSRPQAIRPALLWLFYLFRLRTLLRSPLRGLPISPGLKLFHLPVNPLSRSLDRDFMRERRFPRLCPRSQDHEGFSFSLPGMGPHSLLQWYDLLSSVSSGATSVPMSVGHAAIMEKTLL